jgi:hypothetical protein
MSAEGYALWFESRMNQGTRNVLVEKTQVDDIPIYARKTPLQRAIQLLKRHRDQMFIDDNEVKPISIILTTLAARAYQGESDIESAIGNMLTKMGSLVNSAKPRVPNPVNPEEDFADRWAMSEYSQLKLESNFRAWLKQAQNDFDLVGSSSDVGQITEQARLKFAVGISSVVLSKRLPLIATSVPDPSPKVLIVSGSAPKPWRLS